MPVGYCRELGIPVLLYIDDRLIGEFQGKGIQESSVSAARRSLYIMCQILVRLCYFLNLDKRVLVPSQSIKFLGMICDSSV